MEIAVILILSIILQIIGIFWAIRLIKISGVRTVWLIFVAAFFFRTCRNILFLIGFFQQDVTLLKATEEIFGFFISAFFLLGTIKLEPIFLNYQETIKDLKEIQENYSAIMRGSQDGILVMQDEKIKFVNPSLLKMVGYNDKEVIDKKFVDFVDPVFRNLLLEKNKMRLAGRIRPEEQYEIKILHKNGNSIPVEINISLIQYLSRPATLAIIRNITIRKKNESKKQDANEELSRINQILIGREIKMMELKKELEELKLRNKK